MAIPGLHTCSEAPASLSPSSSSIPLLTSIEEDEVTPDSCCVESNSVESSGTEEDAHSERGGIYMRPLRMALPGLHTCSEAPASLSPSSTSIPPSPSIEVDEVTPDKEFYEPESSSIESSGAESGAEKRAASDGEAQPQMRSTQQGCSAASSLSPSSSPSVSIDEDDSCVHPSHQTAPVRLTERGTAVAAARFLELLRALDPSTGNLTTAQLTKGVTPRAAPAKPERLRSRTPARLEASPSPEAAPAPKAATAEPEAPANPESKWGRVRRMSAEQHSAHTTEMMLLHFPMRRRATSSYEADWQEGQYLPGTES